MSIYYVSIPICITEGLPDSTLSTNKRCAVAIEARSERDALVKFAECFGKLFPSPEPEREPEPPPEAP